MELVLQTLTLIVMELDEEWNCFMNTTVNIFLSWFLDR